MRPAKVGSHKPLFFGISENTFITLFNLSTILLTIFYVFYGKTIEFSPISNI